MRTFSEPPGTAWEGAAQPERSSRMHSCPRNTHHVRGMQCQPQHHHSTHRHPQWHQHCCQRQRQRQRQLQWQGWREGQKKGS